MPFPAAPNFRSGQLDDAWWRYTRNDGSVNVCMTTGSAFMTALRSALGLSPSLTWDDTLQHALVNFADQQNTQMPSTGWDSVRDEVAQDLGQNPSLLSVQLGIFAAYYAPHGERFDAINLLASAVLPLYNAPVAAYADGGLSDQLVCFDPNTDPNPTVQSASDRATAQSNSTYGVRLAPGESPPEPISVPAGPPGLDLFGLAIAGVVFVGVIYAATR